MSGGNGNDLETHIYSSDGRIFQVEYAAKSVETNGTVIGICCLDGVVVAVENIRVSGLLESSSNRRCHAIDRNIGVALAGHLPDGVNCLRNARYESLGFRKDYNVNITTQTLANRLGAYMHYFTVYGDSRPLGTTLVLAGYDQNGPQLFLVDPSGTVAGYHACAAGKGRTVAKTQLEAIDFTKITCEEAVKTAAKILNDAHDPQKDKLWDLEMSWICEKSGRKFEPVPAALVPPKQS